MTFIVAGAGYIMASIGCTPVYRGDTDSKRTSSFISSPPGSGLSGKHQDLLDVRVRQQDRESKNGSGGKATFGCTYDLIDTQTQPLILQFRLIELPVESCQEYLHQPDYVCVCVGLQVRNTRITVVR
jgi:hypothetical protein